ncbi:putative PolB exonuclease-like 3'-5' exonuclease [Rhodoblastus acidophilus]|nr:ribonuclease H-like domain-containing protein [Rhodoblastus acidophilus]MCW2275308.1 putative PolB exonuclease-like 3'-5' exonuclease [Rhodoblastus acidophilus]
MPKPILVFDCETVLDHAAVARAHRLDENDVVGAKAIIGEEFPPPPYHALVCISALLAVYDDDRAWKVQETRTFHAGILTEGQILESFFELVSFTGPILVTYNGSSFDLPAVRSRAMLHRLQGLHLTLVSNYFHRFSENHIDLCDDFASFNNRNRVKLDEICRILGVEGKVAGMNGARVGDLAASGDFAAIGRYCAGDVAATYRLFLLRESFHNRLTPEALKASQDGLEAALARDQGNGCA